MRIRPGLDTSLFFRLPTTIVCASLVLGVTSAASAAAPHEVTLASASQALAFCQSGAMGVDNIDYIISPTGLVQFGPGYNCVQQAATKKNTPTVHTAMLVSGSGAISECTVASAMPAVKLCEGGGLGEYDIAFISGPRYNTVGGRGYGCDIVVHKDGNIGNAICK